MWPQNNKLWPHLINRSHNIISWSFKIKNICKDITFMSLEMSNFTTKPFFIFLLQNWCDVLGGQLVEYKSFSFNRNLARLIRSKKPGKHFASYIFSALKKSSLFFRFKVTPTLLRSYGEFYFFLWSMKTSCALFSVHTFRHKRALQKTFRKLAR